LGRWGDHAFVVSHDNKDTGLEKILTPQ